MQTEMIESKLGEYFEIIEVSVVRDEYGDLEYKYPLNKNFSGFENEFCLISLYDEHPRAFDSGPDCFLCDGNLSIHRIRLRKV